MSKRRDFLKSISFLSSGLVVPGKLLVDKLVSSEKQPQVRHTLVVKGKVTAHAKPCAGVVITDGYEVMKTDSQGNYTFTLHPKAAFIYI